ncbi:MAG: tetratricopeptide repeat protein [Planctomycetes bacterium]|nr:tetratricopeptide repeat protein [Planctomycetota bacterium]
MKVGVSMLVAAVALLQAVASSQDPEEALSQPERYRLALKAIREGKLLEASEHLAWVHAADPKHVPMRYARAEIVLRQADSAAARGEDAEGQYREVVAILFDALDRDPAPWRTTFGRKGAGFDLVAFAEVVAVVADHAGPERWKRLAAHLASGGSIPRKVDQRRFERFAHEQHAARARTAAAYLDRALFEARAFEFRQLYFDEVLAQSDVTPEIAARCHVEVGMNAVARELERCRETWERDRRPGVSLKPFRARLDEERFRSALKASPRDAQAHLGLGIVLRLGGEADRSDKMLLRAVGYKPDLTAAHLYLALNRADAGDAAGAEAHVRDAIAAAPDKVLAWVEYSSILEAWSRTEDAVRAFFEAARSNDADPEMWWRCGQFCYKHNDYEGALEAVQRAVELGRKNVESWTLLGELHRRDGSLTAALPCFEAALRLEPERPETWRSLRLAGQLWGIALPNEQILRMLQDMAARCGESAVANAEIGFLHGLCGDVPAATAAYVKALSYPGKEEIVYESLYELGRAAPQIWEPLSKSILDEEPGRVEILHLDRRLARSFLARISRRSQWFSGGRGGVSFGAHGINHTGAGVYEAMRDWQSSVSGQFGAVGLYFGD